MSVQQFENLELMINKLKNKNTNSNSLDNNRLHLDEKIKNNPLESYHGVSDARAERMIEGGMGNWEAKQSGLSSRLNL